MDNTPKSNRTLFWQSTEQWQNLTQPWTYYEPYIYTRVNNEEKT